MAAASDRARFYLEQQIPELHEYSRKKIFSAAEITSITTRRSTFEHKLNGRGSTAADYARYAEYEMNLDSLRRKRVKRLGVKATNHTGQRRIFSILERGTKKFPGDVGLWMQYLGFARKARANKKVAQIFTKVLRLHPTKYELWVLAAQYAIEEKGDVGEARGFMQRGLRFCGGREGRVWVEYGRLEMGWIGKVVGRRRILGLDEEVGESKDEVEGGFEGDMVVLPKITAEEFAPDPKSDGGLDLEALEKLESSPALSGAIPMAIFDSAVKEFKNDEKLCLQFFDMVAEFDSLPCTQKILDHILGLLQGFAYESPETHIRYIRQPLIGINATASGFPTRLGKCLERMNASFKTLVPIRTTPESARPRAILDEYIIEWLLPYAGQADVDPDVLKVTVTTLKRIWKQYQADTAIVPNARAEATVNLITKIQSQGLVKIAEPARVWALQTWPSETKELLG